MNKLFALLFSCNVLTTTTMAQDYAYARQIVDTLTSSAFWGRGYTNDGMLKAADFIAKEMEQLGVQPLKGKSYFQKLQFSVNTFPGRMSVKLNGAKLVPGVDFIVSQDSRGIKAVGGLQQKDSVTYVDTDNKIIVLFENKLTWSVAENEEAYTVIKINKKLLNKIPSLIDVDIENKLIKNFKANNVCGLVKGTQFPDSVIVFTAHYDHLGGMGSETFFPGANDNASGVSLLLGLAKYYAQHPQPYSVAFIAFAGEEAGLRGSKYFTENPLIPLKNIVFLTNVDLVGTGDDGIMVVNATEYPQQFALLNKINEKEQLVAKINQRGKAANSDHYWFSEKGVPAFFIYTMGGIAAYHDVLDKGQTLPLNEYNDLFKLIVAFNEGLIKR